MSASTPPWTASSSGGARATNSARARIGLRFRQGRAPDSGCRYAAVCLCVDFSNHFRQVSDIFVAVLMVETESDSRSLVPLVQYRSHHRATQSLQFRWVVHCLDLWHIGDHNRRAHRRDSDWPNAALVHLGAE